MFGRQKEPVIDRRQSLDGIPVVNRGVTVEDVPPDRLNLVVRTPRGSGLLARFQPPVLERNIKLDALGTFVFRQIDGERDVRGIIGIFAERYRANRREAELSTVAFLRSLAERRVISIVIK
jgi:hypothetical protein